MLWVITKGINNTMKITKSQLKKLIKEELEVTLTNEEAGEMFGENIEAQLNEVDDLMADPEKLGIILQALGQMAYNFTPAVLGAITLAALKRAVGLKNPAEVKAAAVQAAEEHKAGK
jgi:CO dehydrogenase/acetyl-CoA synthase epsilon subunit